MVRVLTTLALFALAQGAPGTKLQAKPQPVGARAEVQIESTLELDITVKDTGGQEQVRNSASIRSDKFSQEVTEASDGRGRTWRVACTSSTLQRSGTNMPVRTDKTDLDGKTYWVAQAATGWTVKNENGTTADGTAAAVGTWENFDRLLPKADVSAGSTWTVDAADAAGLLAVGNIASPKGTLSGKVESLDAEKAVLVLTGSVEGKTSEGYDLKLTIDSLKVAFDIAKGRPASIAITGGLEATKKVTQGFVAPGRTQPKQEDVGEVKVKSKKFEATTTYR